MPSALSALASLLLTAVSVSAAARPTPGTAASTAAGRVRFVTAKRLYLDRGAADGLRAGDKVSFSRAGLAAGGCTIDLVGAHDAVCRGRGALVGDVFAVPRRPAAASPPAPTPLPAPESNETVERRAAALAASPHDKVDFVPQARAAYVATGSAGIGVAVYATRPGAAQYVGETLDVALHHVPLGSSSFRFDTSFSVIRMQTTSPPRFRPGSGTEFYLWDAEISRREIDSRTVLAVGRIWPWHTPGLPILDGAQLGRRNEPGTIEGGIYAGLLPEMLTLAPTFDAWTTGVYGALSQPGGRDDTIRMAAEEARIGVRHSPTVGWVREAEGQVTLELAGGGVAASGRLRDAPEVDRQPVLELVNGELWARSASVGARVQARYLGVAPELEPLLRDELPRVLGGFHGSVGLSWDPVAHRRGRRERRRAPPAGREPRRGQRGPRPSSSPPVRRARRSLAWRRGGTGVDAEPQRLRAGHPDRAADSPAGAAWRRCHPLRRSEPGRSPSRSSAAHCSSKGGSRRACA